MDEIMEEVLDNAVQMRIDVHVAYIGQEVPCYRLYVNDELFSERKYKFESDTYLSEQLFVKNNLVITRYTLNHSVTSNTNSVILDVRTEKCKLQVTKVLRYES